ncbi:DUF1566 domain-containing protein [Catenovulum sp. SM1970]|uniref:Lcl C-terminal domain-containing protein n=1 Tax=Marinifaba aquimaris TaxID=2741323 RepID=UPI0015741F02|nr:DUF1566 domain-containing protein [Marinifaba aquimaris]NTS78530.1 DUF1566 domain-containing protein [Marinifaba aquimaris]
MKTARLIYSILTILVFTAWCYWQLETPVDFADYRFAKIASNGEPLNPWQGPWACTLDKEQGLLWEVKTDDESIHDGYWTYSWYDGQQGQDNFGDCYFEDNRCDTLDLVIRTNQQALCNVRGWRLPTSAELQSLYRLNTLPQQAQIATQYFPQIKNGDYWSSDHHQALTGHYQRFGHGAKAFNFFSQSELNLPYRNAAFVILVTEQLPSSRTEAGVLSR